MNRALTALLLLGGYVGVAAAAEPWNQFRGPRGEGRADTANPPVTWSESENVAWKTPLAGKAWSSPVVSGDQVWLTNAFEDGKELYAVGLDLATGRELHNLLVFTNEKPQFCHPANSYASPTPFIEPGRLYVHFGAHGTAAIDTTTGQKLWERRDLECDHFRGPASSPIVHGDLLIVQFDGFDKQYVVALNKHTGETAWLHQRAFNYGTDNGDNKKGYGTPSIIEYGGRLQAICTAAVATEALDPETGKVLWMVRHGGMNASTRPLLGHGLLFLTNGMGKLLAVRPDGSGDVSATGIAWETVKQAPKKASPLLIDDLLYMVADNGVASGVEARTGDIVWSERLPGREYAASPIYAGGRVYFFSIEGDMPVLAAGRELQVLAVNKLDQGCMGTPAIVGDALIVRTLSHVYRIEAK